MATLRNEDVAIWVCPYGCSADVVEYGASGPLPNAKVCGMHGRPLIRRCPNVECPNPVYHPSDLDQNFHRPCGARIPWADRRRETAEAMLEYDAFISRLIGTGSYLGNRKPTLIPELTPQERQDLIVPPSDHLPAERVRTPVNEQLRELRPRAWCVRTTAPSSARAL